MCLSKVKLAVVSDMIKVLNNSAKHRLQEAAAIDTRAKCPTLPFLLTFPLLSPHALFLWRQALTMAQVHTSTLAAASVLGLEPRPCAQRASTLPELDR